MLSFSFVGSTCASVSVMFSRSVLADETQESVICPLFNTGKDWLTCHRGQKSTRSRSAGEKSDRKKKRKYNHHHKSSGSAMLHKASPVQSEGIVLTELDERHLGLDCCFRFFGVTD